MVAEGVTRGASPLIAFAGGGTGGHLYPALAIAEALRQQAPTTRFIFFVTRRHVDQRVLGRAECMIVRQTLSPLSHFPWRWPKVYLDYCRSRRACRVRFAGDPPSMVIGTGGLASVPAVREAVRVGIPSAILNPDALPGRANRYLARLVDTAFVQWPVTVKHLPRRVAALVLGCPIRSDFNQAKRRTGLERFGLDDRRKTLLVTGASQGARSINDAVISDCSRLARLRDWQILHLTGEGDHGRVGAAYARCGVAAKVAAYTEHMAEALAACDLVISRAGASTLAEITALGRPSILMPYPYHRDQHQLANAQYLARAQAAQIVLDRTDPEINGPALRSVLEPLMADDNKREAMACAARNLGCRNAAEKIAERILAPAKLRGAGGRGESVEASRGGAR